MKRGIRRERLVNDKAIPSEETTCCTRTYATVTTAAKRRMPIFLLSEESTAEE